MPNLLLLLLSHQMASMREMHHSELLVWGFLTLHLNPKGQRDEGEVLLNFRGV